MKIIIVVSAIILGSFGASDAIASNKCDACKTFVAVTQYQDEGICGRVCAEFTAEIFEEGMDSSAVSFIELGCNGCLSLATRITNGIYRFSFRNIMSGVSRGCTPTIQNCKAYMAEKEDELIDAIYHYKKNTRSICKAMKEC